jgi:Uma2 family endonuclease
MFLWFWTFSNQVRKSWVVWQEGKVPNIVIELLSDTTANHDKSDKKTDLPK